MRDHADALRYEEAARVHRRIRSLERVVAQLRRLDELRRLELCLVAPSADQGAVDVFVVRAGRIAARRTLARGVDPRLELHATLARARAIELSYEPEHLDELTTVASFLDRPPPELRVYPLDADAIAAGLAAQLLVAA
jgi:excinuclease UvrABC nuclease subunit